jgi:hypothetical protein
VSWCVTIRPNAETDLQEARSWYESQRAGLGDELLDEVRRAVGLLETDPERRPFYYHDFRRLLTSIEQQRKAQQLFAGEKAVKRG